MFENFLTKLPINLLIAPCRISYRVNVGLTSRFCRSSWYICGGMVCCRTERSECGWPHTATAIARCSTPFWMSPVASSSSPSCTSYTQTNYLTKQLLILTSVYPGSRILIFTHQGSRISDPGSLIPDPKTATKNGWKKIGCHAISQNWNYFIVEMLKKIIWANFQRIIELFTQKLSKSFQKYRFGIRDPVKTYSGSRSKRHRMPDPAPQHWSVQDNRYVKCSKAGAVVYKDLPW